MEPEVMRASQHIPSGHSHPRTLREHDIDPIHVARGSATDYLKQFKDFAGPYKDWNPPGDRTPAVGEKVWGDHPYLPSYQDPMHSEKVPGKAPDNLLTRGRFYRGASETHTEYVNRGVLLSRVFHDYARCYEEPGLKDEVSVTHSDFAPPRPVLPRDKTPCLNTEDGKGWYSPEPKEPKNPYAKELEYGTREPEVVYVDEAPRRCFNTEHNDNYVCFQEDKSGSKIKDIAPIREEYFLKNIRGSHRSCPHPPERGGVCDESCYVRRQCPGATPQKVDWLLQPMNNAFHNGVMLVPCDCRKSEANRRSGK